MKNNVVAYDVDTDVWTPIGVLEDEDDWPPYLAGYLRESDQFVFIDGFGYGGMLVDRMGSVTEMTVPSDLFSSFGKMDFTAASVAAYVHHDSVCQLENASEDWRCAPLSDGPDEFGPDSSGLLAAVVEDSINERLVLIYGYGNGFSGERFHEVNDIWAVDVDSGQWIQLLERSGQMTIDEEG